jgi:hypothetical protein
LWKCYAFKDAHSVTGEFKLSHYSPQDYHIVICTQLLRKSL